MDRIAIVDDNETWCFVVSQLFEQHGYAVSTFTEPASFLQEAGKYDVVLVDFSIPPRRYQKEMNGPDLIRQLKENLEEPPVMILISAFFTEDILPSVETICPQADGCLSKGMDLQEILQQVQQIIATRIPTGSAGLH
ncbi:response regulator [Leptothermofonsia sichuanensis E412]|uniref:response regulator n=1 Tax=Leptothermofonsia sichuanensis TaxID=2917832 RepID=UPI001CA71433|nr:response regulator [Leptothermofonsia sichuanensis]QZZ21840.1 response regulator [Leptothermofonsia sichuanensis E412]